MGLRYVIVGGGVAGVCCAQEVARLQPTASVCMMTPDDSLKSVTGLSRISDRTHEFLVDQLPASYISNTQIRVTQACVTGLDTAKQLVLTDAGEAVPYDRLCICTGARPKMVADSEHVIVLRDQDTVADLTLRLPLARRAILIGNGGIALELAHALRGMEVVWVMRQGHLGDAFFDLDAASFLLTEVNNREAAPQAVVEQAMASEHAGQAPGSSFSNSDKTPLQPFSSNGTGPGNAAPVQSLHSAAQICPVAHEAGSAAASAAQSEPSGAASLEERRQHGPGSAMLDHLKEAADYADPSTFSMVKGRKGGAYGNSVGPQWSEGLAMHTRGDGRLVLEHNCEMDCMVSAEDAAAQGCSDGDQWPVFMRLTNGKVYGADLVISAIGVLPNISWLPREIQTDEASQGILVDREMRTTVNNVWAAGDCCTVNWPDRSRHWFQMRIWTQARLMGMYAAHCMAGDRAEAAFGFNFELFTHVTRFMNKRVILLGLYNGQGLEHEPDADIVTYSRSTEGPMSSFVRVLLLRNRMMGAVLIGHTDYEETFENLILDGLDLSAYGPDLLSPDIDLAEVFD